MKKLWVDDLRLPPDKSYVCVHSVDEALATLSLWDEVDLIDIDHDAGDYRAYGGDYIKILDWLEEHQWYDVCIRIHSMNPVGVENIRQIIKHNKDKGWKEVFNSLGYYVSKERSNQLMFDFDHEQVVIEDELTEGPVHSFFSEGYDFIYPKEITYMRDDAFREVVYHGFEPHF